MRHPHVLQLIMDSLRYWVTEMHVDGFRFDLASTLARELYDVDRLSAFFDVIHQDPTLAGREADRRAVGPRRRRLSGRQLPRALVRVERQVSRQRARLLARRGPDARRVREPLHRQRRSLPGRRPAAVCERELHHRARRLHAARSRLVQREAQRGQRRGQPDGESHNRSWNCGAEGPTDDPGGQRAARAPAAQLHRDAAAVAGDPDAARRRRDWAARSRATTTPTARTTRSRGSTGSTADRGAARVHAPGHPAAAASIRCSAAAAGSRDVRCAARASATSRGSVPTASAMSEEDWQQGFAKSLTVFLNGDALRDLDADGQAGARRQLPAAVQRASRAARLHAAARVVRRSVGASSSTRRRRWGNGRARFTAGSAVAVEGRSVVVLSRP